MRKHRIKQRIDYRHFIAAGLTLGISALAIYGFPFAFERLIEAFRDLGLSLTFYFCELFKIPHSICPTVAEFSALPLKLPSAFPESWEAFKSAFHAYWHRFIDEENFRVYLFSLLRSLNDGAHYLILIMPLFALVWFGMIRLIEAHNNRYGEETKPLRIFKKISDKTYRPVKAWISSFLDFLWEYRSFYLRICFWMMAYAFGWIVIVIEAFAFYFYFVMSFDFGSIYRQIVKLLYDLSPMFDFVPGFVWAIFGYVVFDKFRMKIALAKLHHMEMMNRGFIAERPIVCMVVGTMGKKKTTLITDMTLSVEAMFRDESFERIREADMKFPYFPWINFENSIRRAMEDHRVFNLVTCKKWVRCRQRWFERMGSSRFIFGYDFKRYGLKYDNKIFVEDLWDVLETYAELYFIYIMQGSLLLSNYSIRTDANIQDEGNFPMWDTDFFSRDSATIDEKSNHAHILDFDMLRLGQKVLEYNEKADAFEFGAVAITEIGKERGNALELQELKKKTDETNQKNDLFNAWIKLVRHSSTVDNFPFVKVLTDEQRPESWGADARQLCEIVHIEDCSEMYMAMPWYHLGELLHDWLFGKFINTYTTYRFHHGDMTLSMYLLKSVVAVFHRRHTRLYNRFGFMKVDLSVEKGTQDGMLKESKYFLMPKKIYARRFSTDAFAEYFNEKALRSALGLEDLKSYATEKATMDELKEQNSYWINDLVKIHSGENVFESKEDVGFLDELKKI